VKSINNTTTNFQQLITLMVGCYEEHVACKKIECWGAGMVIYLQRGAKGLNMVQLMPPPPHHLLLH